MARGKKPRRGGGGGGGGRGSGGGRGGRGGGSGGGGGRRDRYVSYNELPRKHENLENYYNTLLKLDDEAQREEFWAALRTDLPNSFRFCGSKGHALAVKKLLETRYIPQITNTTYDGQPVEPPAPVPWFPDLLAYSMTTPKNVIRKYPPFAAFQKYLVSETSVGNISRQEVVSMIPPLLLDVQPGMTVLDLCAAPGSKSAQLLEMLHRGEEGRMRKVLQSFANEDGLEVPRTNETEDEVDLNADMGDDGRATGVLVANDADYKRCHMLVHQLKRLSSPNMVVTNHDATLFPAIRLPSDDPKKPKYLKFDRVLADVPCTGDGTLRKNIGLWKDWKPVNALNLHLLQARILVKALQALKAGGQVVYSTCSMNPIENEAVVAAAIERCGGLENIEIMDCSDKLPGLIRQPGLKEWKVIDKSHRIWNSWEEVEEFTKTRDDGQSPAKLVRSMFPAAGGYGSSETPLDRCMRVYAHSQNTGAFFITALRKKKEFKAKPEDIINRISGDTEEAEQTATSNGAAGPGEDAETVEATPAAEAPAVEDELISATDTPENQETPAEPASPVKTENKRSLEEIEADAGSEPAPKKLRIEDQNAKTAARLADPKQRSNGVYEDPFKYLQPNHDVINLVKNFYHISPRFPSDRYMVRNAMGEPAKSIYYTNALVRDILSMNEGKGVKFISAGVKMFVKQESPSAEVCRWRIQAEGMPIMQGYVGAERVVHLHKKETLHKLLVEMFPKFVDGEAEKLGEIAERVQTMGLGCAVLRVEPEEGADEDDVLEPMAIPLWKSFHSLNLMLPKEDRAALLLRIFNDTTPLINNGLQRDIKPAKDVGEVKGDAAAEAAAAAKAVEEAPTPEDVGGGGGDGGDVAPAVMKQGGGEELERNL